ncbi:PPE family protein [Mycobacterium xenopi 4042]|uniref:PPE family protein n=1 Tax=Mycobacterium xenopi 4042 TaxID=1299334 RepID=X7YT12_MYCXE|nr:PPE family protein [Mycobacterium xenopi 4042]
MAEPYVQAQAAWQALAADFTAAMSMLTAEIATVSTLWQGMAAQQAQAAFAPYLAWMDSIVAMAQQRAAAAGAQAAAYSTAVVTTPTLAELAENHVTHFILEMTNFLGMNTIPIAVNEFQYFVELWNRAAGAMDEYASATAVNTTFPPFPVAPPIMAMPGRPRRAGRGVGPNRGRLAQQPCSRRIAGRAVRRKCGRRTQRGGAAGRASGRHRRQPSRRCGGAGHPRRPVGITGHQWGRRPVQSAGRVGFPDRDASLAGGQRAAPATRSAAVDERGQPTHAAADLGVHPGIGQQPCRARDLARSAAGPLRVGRPAGHVRDQPARISRGAYGGAGCSLQPHRPPAADPGGMERAGRPAVEEVAQVVSTTSTPGSGSGAVGTGTGMMGP